MTMGQTLVFAPTVATAIIAIYRLLKIIDRNPQTGTPHIMISSQALDQRDGVPCHQGLIAESGTHSKLIDMNGIHTKSHQAQK